LYKDCIVSLALRAFYNHAESHSRERYKDIVAFRPEVYAAVYLKILLFRDMTLRHYVWTF